jgi:uncharacterized OsmC-like protein
MVASAMGIPIEAVDVVVVEGDLDLQGTLGISKDVPVGFESVRARFEIDAPRATAEQLAALHEKTEQYCVVMQTLTRPPALQVEWAQERVARPGVWSTRGSRAPPPREQWALPGPRS